MERARSTWTDERLDDLGRRVENGFQSVDADLRSINERMDEGFRAMNARMDEGFRAVNARIDAQGAELGGRIDSLAVQLAANQRTMIQMLGGVIGVTVLTLISVLATRA